MRQRVPPTSIPGGRRGRLSRDEIREGIELIDYWGDERPRVRSECPQERPCPFVSCQYNLFLDVKGRQVRINFPHLSPDEMRWSCALDEAEDNPDGLTLDAIGQRMNITRERVRQLEGAVLRKLRVAAHGSPEIEMMIEAMAIRQSLTVESDESHFIDSP